MSEDLQALVRDLQVALADRMARGVHEFPRDGGLASPPPVPEGRPAAVSEWTTLASGARGAAPSGAAAMRGVRDDLGDCTRCGLCKTRKNIVFGVGSVEADLVVIGEGPGAVEDERGEPFVGPAGQMLDKMLANVLGLPREQVYILNIVKCRPPRNRNPEPAEVLACRPFLDGQLRALRPKVGLVLGSVAYKALMNTNQGITRARGRWHVYRVPGSDLEIPILPTFHPAYLLRTPGEKRKTFDDLKALRLRYDDLGGRR